MNPYLFGAIATIALGFLLYSKREGTQSNESDQTADAVITLGDTKAGQDILTDNPPLPTNEQIDAYLKTRGFKTGYPYDPLIFALCKISFPKHDPVLVKAIMSQESNFDENAFRVEPDGRMSIGLMQVLTDTAQFVMAWWHLSKDRIRQTMNDPRTNVYVGMKYLQYQIHRYKTRDPAILAASYNAGSVFRRTSGEFANKAYVDSVLRKMKVFKNDFPVS